MAIQAILTGDIVNSTRLGPGREKKLMKTLQQIFNKYKLEFYRGDSFQAFLDDATIALNASLNSFTDLEKFSPDVPIEYISN